MTMTKIELMAATMAELTNDEAAAVLRQMVNTVSWVHDNDGVFELPVAQEFHVAVSKFERPRRVWDELHTQAWDDIHVQAYLMVTPELDGLAGDTAESRRMAVRRHMDELQERKNAEMVGRR